MPRKAKPKATRVSAAKSTGNAKTLVKDLKPRDVNAQYYGPEPNYAEYVPESEEQRHSSLVHSLNWYSSFYGCKDAKDFIIEYLISNGKKNEAKLVKKTPDGKVSTSTGWLARMSLRGWKLNEKETIRISDEVVKLIELIKPADTESEDQRPKQNIQEIMREKAVEAAGEIEGLFDDYLRQGYPKSFDTKNSVVSALSERNILPQHVNPIVSHWESVKTELEEARAGECPQLSEGYSHLTKTQLKNAVNFVESIISSLHGYVSLKQVSRKPRTRKPVPVEKIVAKLKHLKEFKDESLSLEITGVSPVKLHGASEAWVYDTKKRKLHHYVADEYSKSFTVKGNTLLGFDKKLSIVKTLRKPSEQLKPIMGSKPAARKFFATIKAVEITPTGRFNSDMIILRAF